MLIADRYPPERRGAAMGWLIASTSLGYALSLVLSGWMVGLGGYELAFLVTAIGPVLGAAVAWLALRSTLNVVHTHQRETGLIREMIHNRPAVRLTVGYTFHSWELLGMWAWVPAFLVAALAASAPGGLQGVEFGAYLAGSFHIMGWLASSSMGRLSDRLGRRTVLVTLAAASTACSFVFGWLIGLPIAVVAVVGAVYAFTALGDSPVLSTAITEEIGRAHV